MTTPRLALIGLGKMGRAIQTLAWERGWPPVVTIGSGAGGVTHERLAGAQVAIEFTTPGAAAENIIACAKAGVPVVVGTTGWDDERARVEREVIAAGGAMLASPNFSLGMAMLWRLGEPLGALAAHARGFDVHIVETHHTAKKDAPSGSARALAAKTRVTLGRDIPITSVRIGSVPGTHELIVDGPFEQLRLVHEVRDRRVFAEGALAAAAWLVGRKGIFSLIDLLEGTA